MATVYVDHAAGSDANAGTQPAPKRTVQAGVTACANGDTLVIAPTGTYNETVALGPSRNGLNVVSSTSKARPLLDGGGAFDRGFDANSDGVKNISIDAVEVKNYRIDGIRLSCASLNTLTNHKVTGCEVHHIGETNTARVGYTPNQIGIHFINGVNNQATDNNKVHHIGPGGEAIGIWHEWGDSPIITGNEVYLCRKEGIRCIYSKTPTVKRNLIFGCWSGHTFEYWVGGVCEQNMIYGCSYGLYLKQINDDTHAPNVRTTWGGGTPIPAAWVYCRHNTVYDCSMAHLATLAGGSAPGDMGDVRNNIFLPGPEQGAAFIQDGYDLRGPNWVVDGNLYGTAGVAPNWLYMRKFNYTDPLNQTSLAGLQSQTGWETNGLQFDPKLIDPANGLLDYWNSSQAVSGSVDLTSTGSTLGKQLGARGMLFVTEAYKRAINGTLDSFSSGNNPTTHLTDYNDQTTWTTATHTGSGGVGINDWMIVDYGSAVTFDHVIAYVFSHDQTYNPQKVRLEVSNDKVAWTNLSVSPGIVGWANGTEIVNNDFEGSSYKYELAKAVSARYLRYTIIDTFGAEFTITAGVEVGRLVPVKAYRGRTRRRALVT